MAYLLEEAFSGRRSLVGAPPTGRTGTKARALMASTLAALVAVVLLAWLLFHRPKPTPVTPKEQAHQSSPAQTKSLEPSAGAATSPQLPATSSISEGSKRKPKKPPGTHLDDKTGRPGGTSDEGPGRTSTQVASATKPPPSQQKLPEITNAASAPSSPPPPIVPPGPSTSTPLLEVFSRDNKIEPGLSFSYKDPQLGEMAHGDLKAILRMPAYSKGSYTITWLVDDVPMDFKRIPSNQVIEYDNEPTPGTYKVIVRKNLKQITSVLFRITK